MSERRTVLITGAASGFGYESTKKFAADPKYDPVIAIDKNPLIHERFPSDQFERVTTVKLDVRDTQKTAALVDKVLGERGAIDVLVNNAGIMISGRTPTFFDDSGNPTDELRAMWETNVKAPLELMLRVLGHMRNRKRGVIINITSSSPYNRTPHRAVYADYKAVFAGATKLVGQREKPFNIRIVNVEPGMHVTSLDNGNWTPSSDEIDAFAAQFLYFWWRIRFAASPDKVAGAIYQIAEGEVTDDTVSIGLDSQFARFMHEYFPLWKELFVNGYKALHLYNKLFLIGIVRLNEMLDSIVLKQSK